MLLFDVNEQGKLVVLVNRGETCVIKRAGEDCTNKQERIEFGYLFSLSESTRSREMRQATISFKLISLTQLAIISIVHFFFQSLSSLNKREEWWREMRVLEGYTKSMLRVAWSKQRGDKLCGPLLGNKHRDKLNPPS